jgi:hypothetical protein
MNRTGERFLNSILTTTENGANVGAQTWLLRSAGWAFPIRRVRARSGAIFGRPLPCEGPSAGMRVLLILLDVWLCPPATRMTSFQAPKMIRCANQAALYFCGGTI